MATPGLMQARGMNSRFSQERPLSLAIKIYMFETKPIIRDHLPSESDLMTGSDPLSHRAVAVTRDPCVKWPRPWPLPSGAQVRACGKGEENHSMNRMCMISLNGH
jgi:hypothetical protein